MDDHGVTIRTVRSRGIPLGIAIGTSAALALGALLVAHARGTVNRVALASSPKPVTVVEAKAGTYRATRRYVGTVEPWVSAKLGPQLVSAYVDTVLVRPGAAVRRGQVIATLDCRNASAGNQAVAMQARALASTQAAIANRAARMSTLLKGGFAAPDTVEMKQAESQEKQAQLLGLKAQMLGSALQVQDCILRSPFDGEVSERLVDPGAFARPGSPIASVIDRNVVRVSAEVPENDFAAVTPGTPVRVHFIATGQDVTSTIARRAPAADESTRTVHVEIDLPNRDRAFPVGTTAEITLDVGQPVPATEIPLAAAAVRGKQATVVVVEGDVARKRTVGVRGESGGSLYTGTELASGAFVVLQGRESVADGDRVAATKREVAVAMPPRDTREATADSRKAEVR